MCTLRLSLAVTMILTLLAGLGGVAIAGDEGAPAADRPHKVSGTSVHRYAFESETCAADDAGTRLCRKGSRDSIEMDDARLSGDLWLLWDRYYLGGGEVMAGTVELTNDDGAWVGTMRGYKASGLHNWQLELTGTDTYEGLSALLNSRGVSTYSHEVDGFVFPGTLPAYPDPVEVPAE